MKTMKTILIAVIALFSVQMVSAQCNGTLSVTGTDPTFTFTSTNSTGPNMTYYWDFGDGNYSYAQQSVSHTYATNGVFAVVCYFTDSLSACSDVDSLSVSVISQTGTCDASFTTAGNGPSFVFTPINTPSAPLGYYNFVWDFGDGTIGSTANMTGIPHTYTANGTYTVSCVVYDSIYCIDTAISTVVVTGIGSQTCDATFMQYDSNGTVYFVPSSPFAGANYLWDFGDGSTSTAQNPIHTYLPTGTNTFTACLTISDPIGGCSDSSCVTFTLNTGGTTCDASFTSTLNQMTVNFTPSFPMTGTTYSWDFGDGTTSTLQNPTHVYSSPSGTTTYNVCLTVTNTSQSCTDTECQSIVIFNPSTNNVYGWVEMGNSMADSGVVFLIEFDSILGTLTAVDTTSIDSSGSYAFYNVAIGSYLVKAALSPNSIGYSSYLPTYYAAGSSSTLGGELLWSDADFAFSPNNSIVYGISLVAGTNLGGPGFVGGLVSQGANKVGDPISDILMMVTDLSGNPVAYSYSDISGSFSIGNLAYGDYILYPEVYGKTTNALNFTLSSSNTNEVDFRVDVNSTTVDVSIATGINPVSAFSYVKLYPNPVQNELNIDFGSELNTDVSIQLLDVSGRLIYSNSYANSTTVRIPTSNYENGIYFVKISNENAEQLFKFVKQ